jgi:hypothetical protein
MEVSGQFKALTVLSPRKETPVPYGYGDCRVTAGMGVVEREMTCSSWESNYSSSYEPIT